MEPFPYPIVDHHAHLRPGPGALEAVRRFASKGGTHLFLATQNYLDHPPVRLEEYREQFETTLALAHQLRMTTPVQVFAILAPFPIDLVQLSSSRPLPECESLHLQALELASRLVREQKAVALGEVGLAHFPVSEQVAASLDRVLEHAIRLAKEVSCPLVLHTDDLDEPGYRGLAERASKEGFPLAKLVKHYARSYLPPPSRHGVTPSFLAQREVIRSALSDSGPWFLETDYLDDPARPGAVLALDTVPRRVTWLMSSQAREENLQALRVPFVEAPRSIYGLDLERR